MSLLKLERPIVFLDLETTGTDLASDRIVEIAVLRVEPGGQREERARRIDPERPIPPEATRVHGIRDEDVRGQPTFRQIAKGLLEFLGPADLAGFNIARFDLPLLERELRDAGLDAGLGARRVIDAMSIFHRKERRDLAAAVRFYLGREHEGAHSGREDVVATLEVLEAQLERYPDLPRTVSELASWGRPQAGPVVDREGKFVWSAGEATFAFGRHQGKSLGQVAAEAPDYLEWILGTDFPPDAKELVRRALGGELPEPPPTDQSA